MTGLRNGGGQLFEGPFFRLRLPVQWEAEIIENIPAFFDPDGQGVIQVAAVRRNSGDFDAQAELERYLSRNNIEPDTERMARFQLPSGLNAVSVEYIVDNRFWMVTAATKGPQFVLLMYNADEVPGADTAMLISEIIATVEFTSE